MSCVYKLDGHKAVRCTNFTEWSRWYEKGNRQVALTPLGDGRELSTIFTAVDYGMRDKPELFETAVLSPLESDQVCARYATWDDAMAGHHDWLARMT